MGSQRVWRASPAVGLALSVRACYHHWAFNAIFITSRAALQLASNLSSPHNEHTHLSTFVSHISCPTSLPAHQGGLGLAPSSCKAGQPLCNPTNSSTLIGLQIDSSWIFQTSSIIFLLGYKIRFAAINFLSLLFFWWSLKRLKSYFIRVRKEHLPSNSGSQPQAHISVIRSMWWLRS